MADMKIKLLWLEKTERKKVERKKAMGPGADP